MSLDELVGRKDEGEVFAELVKRYIPADVKFGENDDIMPVIGRFLRFLEENAFAPEDRLRGLQEVFLADISEKEKL